MISGLHLDAFLFHAAGRLEDGPRLHPGDLGKEMPRRQPRCPSIGFISWRSATLRATTRGSTPAWRATHSRSFSPCGRNSWSGGSSVRIVTGPRAHRAEEADEVLALHREDLVERALAVLGLVREDHLAHRRDALAAEEHVLRAAEADAFGAERDRVRGLVGLVGVGAHLQPPRLVGPLHERRVALVDLALLRVERAVEEDLQDLRRLRRDAPSMTSPVVPSMESQSPS